MALPCLDHLRGIARFDECRVSEEQGGVLNGIGNVHLSLGNDDIAMESFSEALKGESKPGSATGQAINHANIGALYEENGWKTARCTA